MKRRKLANELYGTRAFRLSSRYRLSRYRRSRQRYFGRRFGFQFLARNFSVPETSVPHTKHRSQSESGNDDRSHLLALHLGQRITATAPQRLSSAKVAASCRRTHLHQKPTPQPNPKTRKQLIHVYLPPRQPIPPLPQVYNLVVIPHPQLKRPLVPARRATFQKNRFMLPRSRTALPTNLYRREIHPNTRSKCFPVFLSIFARFRHQCNAQSNA